MPCKVLAYSTTNCSMLCCIFTDRHTVQYIDAATCTVQYVETIGRSESSRYCKRVHFTFTRSAPLMLTVLYVHHCCFPQFACLPELSSIVLNVLTAVVHSLHVYHSCCPIVLHVHYSCFPYLYMSTTAVVHSSMYMSTKLFVNSSTCPLSTTAVVLISTCPLSC